GVLSVRARALPWSSTPPRSSPVCRTLPCGDRGPTGQFLQAEVVMAKRTCLDCGAITTASRCSECASARQRARDRERGSSARRGYGSAYRRARARLLAGSPPCYWCGAPATTADHLVPLARGGTSDANNLVPSCEKCNFARQDRFPWSPPVRG